MMKYENTQKITALGVVIFSFAAILGALVIAALFGCLSALLVLKTSIPESFIKIGNVLGGGIGMIAASAFLTAAGKVKGILSAGIIATAMILIKVIGNTAMGLGGYFGLSGWIGILFVLLFSVSGGIIGTMMKK